MSASTGRKRQASLTKEEIRALTAESDRRIRLDHETHIYYIKDIVDGVEVERPAESSSSRVLSMMFPPFNDIEVASSLASRPGIYGTLGFAGTLKKWEDGAANGSEFHAMVEDYYKIDEEDVEALAAWREKADTIEYRHLVDAFLEYASMMRRKGWRPYRSEQPIFDIGDNDPFTRYPPGTADMIYIRGDDEHMLVDFKTAENEKKFTETKSPVEASYPLQKVPSSNLYKGHIQTAVYSALRETLYHEPVETQAIIAFYWGDTPLKWKMYQPPRSFVDEAEKVIKLFKKRREIVYRTLAAYGNKEEVRHPYLPM
jgi:PD-(D/E)XK nuclease superfamily